MIYRIRQEGIAKINIFFENVLAVVNEKLVNLEYVLSASSDAFFLFHRSCLRAGMYIKEKTLSLLKSNQNKNCLRVWVRLLRFGLNGSRV